LNIVPNERDVVQLNRIYSNLDELFTPIHFNAAAASVVLNVIFAEVKQKRSKQTDSHNLGKTTLIGLIDFLLLKEITGSDHFLWKHKDRFRNFVFYMELVTHGGAYITIRRSVDDQTAVGLKLSNATIEDAARLADNDWDHWSMTLTAGREALNAWLDLKVVAPWDYRTGVSYFLRTQADYAEYFQIQKFMQGKDRQWKPYLAGILGLDHEAILQKYDLEDEISEKTNERDKRLLEIEAENQGRGELVTRIEIARDEIAETDSVWMSSTFMRSNSK
jgi:uncharacterized protein YydD (DUF2326 family)